MRKWTFGRTAAIGWSIAALALMPHVAMASSAVKVLYSFKGGNDGAVPTAPLVEIAGTFYGTTSHGGGTGCGGEGCGTVFSIGPDGGEHVIHRFAGSPSDGAIPIAGLVNVGGTLYGTTSDGGANKCGPVHCGTVISVGVNGAVNVIYNFKGGKDGAIPDTDLVLIGSQLYGATYVGGGGTGCEVNLTCGTFYSVTPGGAENVIHVFGGVNGRDGGNPSGSLIDIGGRIYGTTEFGGRASCGAGNSKEPKGCGTVYSMTTGGGEKVLYEFKGGADGRLPTEGVIDVAGELFGTTSEGGDSICGGGSCGILYSMSTGGAETVLHTFALTAASGLEPSGLIFYSNNLYGVTFGGGNHGCGNTLGCGIAYSASTGGHVTVLHDFGSLSGDAQEAESRLIQFSHKLYGVSHRGGTGKCTGGPDDSTGCGTVFQLTP